MKIVDGGTWKKVLGILYSATFFFTIAEFGFVEKHGNTLMLFLIYEAVLLVAMVSAFLPTKRQNAITTVLVVLPIVAFLAGTFFVNIIPR